MNKAEVCEQIKKIGIVPAIRVSSAEEAHFAADAVAQGGIPIVEITMTVPDAVELISHLVRDHEKLIVGAGTVLDTETARKCVDAGVHFLTAPGFDVAIVEFAAKANVTVFPGAFTPTEVVTAWRCGSDFVKVFPCGLAGPKYIKSLKTALPQIPLIAAGGITQQTAGNFILAGATAIGVGTDLIPSQAIQQREATRIRELAHRFAGFVADARRLLEPPQEPPKKVKPDFWKFHRPAHPGKP